MTIVARKVQAEEALWHDFDKAANQNHTPGDQALKELMRDYVDQAKHERQQRVDAVKFANASVELEGFQLSKEYLDLQEQFVNGEIEIKELIDYDAGKR